MIDDSKLDWWWIFWAEGTAGEKVFGNKTTLHIPGTDKKSRVFWVQNEGDIDNIDLQWGRKGALLYQPDQLNPGGEWGNIRQSPPSSNYSCLGSKQGSLARVRVTELLEGRAWGSRATVPLTPSFKPGQHPINVKSSKRGRERHKHISKDRAAAKFLKQELPQTSHSGRWVCSVILWPRCLNHLHWHD